MAVAALSAGGCVSSFTSQGRLRDDRWTSAVERVERVRGLRLTHRVDARVVTRDRLADVASRAMTEQWAPGELERYVDGLTVAGLWPSGRDYVAAYAAVIGDGGAGLYVPAERALYLVRDQKLPIRALITATAVKRDAGRETALAHEIVHALQHQAYPGLVWIAERVHDNDDLQLSVLSSLEGDAVRYSYAASESPGLWPAPVDLARELSGMAQRKPMSDAPALIREVIVSSYALGYRLATLEASLLLDTPPASSEQLLHLDRRSERFIATSFEDLHDTLPEGCEFVHENTVGEVGMRVLLRRHAIADPESVADGWNGDRYLAARCNGDAALLWITRWDSEEDAAQFESAYAEIAERVGTGPREAARPSVRRSGVEVLIVSQRLEPLRGRVATARQAIVASVDEVARFYGLSAALADLERPAVRKVGGGLLSSTAPRESPSRRPARRRRPVN